MGTKARPKADPQDKIEDLTPRQSEEVKGGKVSTQDFSFTHKVDKASPSLG
jgi:type VI protein secretion system component Hcp